jgi:hypothetical protein
MATQASALLITPSTSGYEGIGTNMQDIRDYFGYNELYMSAFEGSDTGPLAGSYNTTFSNLDSDREPQNATISYVGGDIVAPTAYLTVKDGRNGNPSWYAFNLTDLGWTGTETIYVQNFWVDSPGAISNVALFGQGTSVPEPATMLLLGSSLIGLVVFGRKNKKTIT